MVSCTESKFAIKHIICYTYKWVNERKVILPLSVIPYNINATHSTFFSSFIIGYAKMPRIGNKSAKTRSGKAKSKPFAKSRGKT